MWHRKNAIPYGLSIAITFGLGCLVVIGIMAQRTNDFVNTQVATEQVQNHQALYGN